MQGWGRCRGWDWGRGRCGGRGQGKGRCRGRDKGGRAGEEHQEGTRAMKAVGRGRGSKEHHKGERQMQWQPTIQAQSDGIASSKPSCLPPSRRRKDRNPSQTHICHECLQVYSLLCKHKPQKCQSNLYQLCKEKDSICPTPHQVCRASDSYHTAVPRLCKHSACFHNHLSQGRN